MDQKIYILKNDLIKFFKFMPGTEVPWDDLSNFEYIKKLIDAAPLYKGKYIDRDLVYDIVQTASEEDKLDMDSDDTFELVDTIPSVHFIDSYEQELVLREDIIAAFEKMFEEQQIMYGSPDYEFLMGIIKGIPSAKAED